ncbi:glycoside hydrolase family 3 C-terminal domain-containing protein [Ruminococcaceae bacterium OttesenSCG-928-O06]|nr:glycoside hydrolase family 3 C-terminal domain-containing protein [Ruminococcaceae bacterium OttesenSCG-928-O06]
MNDTQLWQKVQSLTTAQKVALCRGTNAWQTASIPEKGIPSLRMADGPHGVRVEDAAGHKQNGGPSKPATCFPPQVTLACAFSPQLVKDVGAAIAEECLHYGVGLILGPGTNIKRSPLGGRNFEYYSEDPLLAGRLAAAFIEGTQENGVGTSLKHFAVNSQECFRMSINAAVDERALFDIYLRPFEIAIKTARPDTVMASYNRVNGEYATQNRRLLTDILRLRFGFGGAVVSDWGAIDERAAALAAGCDLEMPASGGVSDKAVLAALKSGALPTTALDTACFNILRLVYRRAAPCAPQPACNWQAHHALAVQALEKSAVLLKNDGMLPLAPSAGRVAIIGQMADEPRYQGSGSSVVNPKQLVSFLAAMKTAGHPFVYAPGHRGTKTTPKMLAAAVAAAQNAQQVVLFLGLPDAFECEGYDRQHLDLPACQLKLLSAVQAANPNVCVVLCCGGPVATPWLGKVRALLCLHLGGQGLGTAAVRLLYGQANPSGKLTESWPLAIEDTPCYHSFPMGPCEVAYRESIYVGYRYYNTAGAPVQFPFGFGLSYTSFAYSALRLAEETLAPGGTLHASLRVKNTGAAPGEEVVQLYLAHEDSATYQPAHQLLAFHRVALQPGQEKELSFTIPYAELSFYDVASGEDVVEAGHYTLQAASHSRDIRLCAGFAVQGATLRLDAAHSAHGPYGNIQGNTFPTKDFAALYQKPLQENRLPQKGEYGRHTPLGLMTDGAAGRVLLRTARFFARRFIRFSQDAEANRLAADATSYYLPFKNVPMNTDGIVPPRAAAALLRLCNGQGGLGSLLAGLLLRR